MNIIQMQSLAQADIELDKLSDAVFMVIFNVTNKIRNYEAKPLIKGIEFDQYYSLVYEQYKKRVIDCQKCFNFHMECDKTICRINIFQCNFCYSSIVHPDHDDECDTKENICGFLYDAGWRPVNGRFVQLSGAIKFGVLKCPTCRAT